jgi:hypothetical protein
MSKIIKISKCDPLCPRFFMMGQLARQSQSLARDIACYSTIDNSRNFWIRTYNWNNIDARIPNGFPKSCCLDFINCGDN